MIQSINHVLFFLYFCYHLVSASELNSYMLTMLSITLEIKLCYCFKTADLFKKKLTANLMIQIELLSVFH